MRLTRSERLVLLGRVQAPWRRLNPHRVVRRRVQGVDLYLPWSHRLPDYAAVRPEYGQNLVHLARALARPGEPLHLLDIGANAGDSTAQILAAVDARALCVEADPYWTAYLRRNLGADERVAIVAALLTEGADRHAGLVAQRVGGTTRFVTGASGTAAEGSIAVDELRARHPDFDGLRLVKSDTDGFDPYLVPAVARAWRSAGPVLFFEFDPDLARRVDARDPFDLWGRLADLGYDRLVLWDNTGDVLGALPIERAGWVREQFDRSVDERGFHFVDVAACRADDPGACAAFDVLVSGAADRVAGPR